MKGGLTTQAVVECKDLRVTAKERDQLIAQQAVTSKALPKHRWIVVSSVGFAADTRNALETTGFDCVTYAELLRDLVLLDNYVQQLIRDYEEWVADEKNWSGRDLFIRPDIETDISCEKRPALTHLSKWLGDSRGNLLVLLGDLGTGKSTLSRFLAYQLACSFRDDPLRHPAPVLIPLGEVRKEVSLDSIVVKHFRDRGISGLNFTRFEHLVRQGKIVLFFDAFDEMADRVRWDITRSNFQELRRAAEGVAKVVLTCRTHYFKDRTEQSTLIGQGSSMTAAETALYKELRQQSNAEVVYLQEFNEEQIRAYLRQTRGANADADWLKIQDIYNLRDLPSRPLLLDLIVKTLPQLQAGQPINAANLYTVYTNVWVERDFKKWRVVLDATTKLALMTELAWVLWRDEKSSITARDLAAFVTKLHSDRTFEFVEDEVEDIAREVQAASFLRRDRDGGEFHFMHRSFGEFFLAKKLLASLRVASADGCLTATPSACAPSVSSPLTGSFAPTPMALGLNSSGSAGASPSRFPASADLSVLKTRRFDRKVIYFLTLLDESDALCPLLQTILTSPYMEQVSENALQILYWSGRVRCDMLDDIPDDQPKELAKLCEELARRIPLGVQLADAELEEVILEAATFANADFARANLTKANLNRATITDSVFANATLIEARAENLDRERVDLRNAEWQGATWTKTRFIDCLGEFASIENGIAVSESVDVVITGGAADVEVAAVTHNEAERWTSIAPIVQVGSPSAIRAVAWSREGKLLAVGGDDGVIRLYSANDGRLLRTLEGHQSSVWSVAFDPQGGTLASGSDDNTVKLWESATGTLLRTLAGHVGPVRTVCFAPNGKYLVAAGSAGRLQFWDVERFETFLYLYTFGSGAWLALLPDGRFDGSPDALRYLCYTERGSFKSYTAEELVSQFHAPQAIRDVLARYHVPLATP